MGLAFFSTLSISFQRIDVKAKDAQSRNQRQVLSYIFEDPDKPRSASAAEKKFKVEGHMVYKQSIHGWIAKKEQILEGSIT